MLVVMLLLLIVTATATFAMHSTSVELRSTGHSRQRMQTRYVAEAALASSMTLLEQSGSPDALAHSLEASRLGSTTRRLAPEEPHMAAAQANHRVELSQFLVTPGVGMPIETTPGQESLGVGMGYVPVFAVDVNDDYTFTGAVAGHRSDGGGMLAYLAATYTARGRTVLPGDTDPYSPTYAPGTAPHLRRGYHETAVNARAIGVSGPMPRR